MCGGHRSMFSTMPRFKHKLCQNVVMLAALRICPPYLEHDPERRVGAKGSQLSLATDVERLREDHARSERECPGDVRSPFPDIRGARRRRGADGAAQRAARGAGTAQTFRIRDSARRPAAE